MDGSTKNLITYCVRAPEGYKEGDAKRWPTLVILHGSNMNARDYVATLASAWPDIARDYLILGINGEVPSDLGDQPRFNFSYVNYMGRSTYKGFPATDRESPGLISEALDELRKAYPVGRYFVGGHSQGGWLTYSLLMNFPERIAGAFPISCGLMFQCEPDAYKDEALRGPAVGAIGDRPRPERSRAGFRHEPVCRNGLRRIELAGPAPVHQRDRGPHVRKAAGRRGDPMARGPGVRRPRGPDRIRREAGRGR